MNDKPFSTDELFLLLGRACNEALIPSESERLRELLEQSRAARRMFADYMILHSELNWICQAPDGVAPGTEVLDSTAPPLPAANHVTAPPPSAGGLAGPAFGVPGSALLGGLVMAAVLGWAATTWWFTPPLAPGARPGAEAPAGSTEAGRIVARITGTRNCLWDATSRVGYDSPLHAGQRLTLRKGLAEITFDDGAVVVLEGPAAVVVQSQTNASLQTGRLAATVPLGAEGFTVETSRLKVVDLGTEFGVLTDPQRSTEVHVFNGKVRSHILDDAGKSIRTLYLHSEQGARLDMARSEVTHLAANARGFVRNLPTPDGPRRGLLACEGFFYSTGPLSGRNGSFGWSGAWFDIASDGRPGSNGIAAGSLTFEEVSAGGNRAVQKGQRNRIRRTLDTSVGGVFDLAGMVENQDGVRLIGKDGSTVYLSFLQRTSAVDDVFYGLEVHRGDGNANRVLCIGNGADGTGYGVSSRYNGYGQSMFESVGAENTGVNLFVVRFTFGQDNQDTVDVYRNCLSLTDESRATIDASLRGNFAFDRIGMGNFNGSKTHEVDRIQIGTSLEAVTGNPPPTMASTSGRASAGRRRGSSYGRTPFVPARSGGLTRHRGRRKEHLERIKAKIFIKVLEKRRGVCDHESAAGSTASCCESGTHLGDRRVIGASEATSGSTCSERGDCPRRVQGIALPRGLVVHPRAAPDAMRIRKGDASVVAYR